MAMWYSSLINILGPKHLYFVDDGRNKYWLKYTEYKNKIVRNIQQNIKYFLLYLSLRYKNTKKIRKKTSLQNEMNNEKNVNTTSYSYNFKMSAFVTT